jgi:hypothetical protein
MKKGLERTCRLIILSANFSMKHAGKTPLIPWQASGVCLYLSLGKLQINKKQGNSDKMHLQGNPKA